MLWLIFCSFLITADSGRFHPINSGLDQVTKSNSLNFLCITGPILPASQIYYHYTTIPLLLKEASGLIPIPAKKIKGKAAKACSLQELLKWSYYVYFQPANFNLVFLWTALLLLWHHFVKANGEITCTWPLHLKSILAFWSHTLPYMCTNMCVCIYIKIYIY